MDENPNELAILVTIVIAGLIAGFVTAALIFPMMAGTDTQVDLDRHCAPTHETPANAAFTD